MSKANRRFYRTVVLGLIALAVLVWAAIEQFGIPLQEMSHLLLITLWVAGGIIVLAAVCALLWVGLRKLLRQDGAR